MRNILAIGLFIIACLFVVSCKEEDTSLQGKMGYFRLDVAPERRAQVVFLQFVSDPTPSGYSAV